MVWILDVTSSESSGSPSSRARTRRASAWRAWVCSHRGDSGRNRTPPSTTRAKTAWKAIGTLPDRISSSTASEETADPTSKQLRRWAQNRIRIPALTTCQSSAVEISRGQSLLHDASITPKIPADPSSMTSLPRCSACTDSPTLDRLLALNKIAVCKAVTKSVSLR